MRCVKEGCREEAEPGSNYCSEHSSSSRQIAKDDTSKPTFGKIIDVEDPE